MNKTIIISTKITTTLLVLLCVGFVQAQNLTYIGNENTLSALELELNRLSETSGGTMGIAVHHLETGIKLSIRGEERFLMASTYKIPVAVTLLQQVDEGLKKLSDRVEIKEEDMGLAYGVTEHLQNPGIVLSLHNLLEPMLMASDNTSTDVLMEQVGGPKHITKRMIDAGVDSIKVGRNTATLIRDYFKIPQPPEGQKRSLLKEIEAFTPEEVEKLSVMVRPEFDDDGEDTTTPNAMAKLLKKIWEGKLLSEENTILIKDIMLRCKTGENRLKGILPDGTPVAHKTGTLGGTSNDVGVITLPNNKGHLIVAVYIKESSLSSSQRDRAIAEIARAAHDYFIFSINKN